MTEPQRPLARQSQGQYEMASDRQQPADLADILERVLDKGIVIAGDIKVNLLEVELLTIKIRLLSPRSTRPRRWASTGGRTTRC